MGEKQKRSVPYGQTLLAVLGVALIAAGVVGAFGDKDEKIVSLLLIGGLGLVVLAAFFPRIQGTVELGNWKIPIAAALRAEEQLSQGNVVDAAKTPDVLQALEDLLAKHQERPSVIPRGSEGNLATSMLKIQRGRDVKLVDDAVVTMATLTNAEVGQIKTEIARMSSPGFREEDDPRAIRSGDQGRSYRVRKVPGTDLRLWYRPLDSEHPKTLVVMVIQREGERV